MTPNQKAYHAQLVTKIHLTPLYQTIYKNDRDLYESFLINSYGVDSSKKLSITELNNLIDYFSGKTKTIRQDPKGRPTEKGMATDAQIAKIETMWQIVGRDKSDSALRNFIKRQTGEFPLHLKKLTLKEATGVILALEKMSDNGGGAA